MPLPTPCTVSGGGAYCAGGAGVSITLGCSTIGVTYMLFTGGAPAGAPVAGTGGAITFGPETVAGTYTVVATIAATGCSRAMTGSATVTINPLPAIYAVTGGGIYCAGGAGVHIGLSSSDPGVIYHVYRGTTLVATLTGTGGPLDFGPFTTASCTYTITATSAAGCTSSMSGSATVGINPAPPACPVTGGGSYCAGGTGVPIGLGCSTTGVNYQLFLGPTAVGLPVSGTGGAITFGTFTAAGTYTAVATSSTTGCSSPMTGSATITISPLPTITGGTAVCVGSSIPLSATPGGGTWSSSNTSDVTVSSTGVATGVTTSTCATITYTSPAGCVSTTATVCVSPSPSTITGPASVCVGSCIGLTDVVSGGTWTSSNTTIATAGLTSGSICGVVPGTVTITYSLGSGCTKTTVIAVTSAPSAIGGPSAICNGACVTETDLVGGGTWSSGNTAVATIVSTGTTCGVGTGTATITYTVGGCIATKTITVNFAPTPLGGPGSVCSGAMIGLIEGVGGGTWTSSNTARATVDGTGMVTGGIVTAAVTDTISYSLGGSCVVEKIITVDPISAISGPTGVCVGATATLSDGTGGGTWSSSATGIATIGLTTGTYGGITPGPVTVTYTTAAGCTATTTVTVQPAPVTITGPGTVCASDSILLTDAVGGGTWTSSNTLAATTDLLVGEVHGIGSGTTTISYSLGSGCIKTSVVTVLPQPSVTVTTATHVCAGSAITLSGSPAGGTWTSSNTATATVTGGTVTGGTVATATTVTITYTIGTGCRRSTIKTVNPVPPPITGNTTVCEGVSTDLSDGVTGGTWTSSNTTVATAGLTTGIITGGGSPGTSTVTYITGGCP